MAHRDYDVRVSGRPYRLRVREGQDGTLEVRVGGRALIVRPSGESLEVEVGGRRYHVAISSQQGQRLRVSVAGRSFEVEVAPLRPAGTAERAPVAAPQARRAPVGRAPSASRARVVKGAITSPMPGKVVALKVKPGDKVRKGDVLLVIEAMKMENEIKAPRDGIVREVLVSEGSSVSTGQPLLALD